MADATTLLTTIVQTSATIVAIVGGFMASKLVSIADRRNSLHRERRRLDQEILQQLDDVAAADDLRGDKGNLASKEHRAGHISEFELELRNITYRQEMHDTRKRLRHLEKQRDKVTDELTYDRKFQHSPAMITLASLIPLTVTGVAWPMITLSAGVRTIDDPWPLTISVLASIVIVFIGIWLAIQVEQQLNV